MTLANRQRNYWAGGLLQSIPVVFAVDADPFGTRFAESFERSGRDDVTGTFNRVPESSNIEIIKLDLFLYLLLFSI